MSSNVFEEFFEEHASASPRNNLSPDLAELSELIVGADQSADDNELGGMEFDPGILRSAVELPHHNQLKPQYKGMYVRYSSSCSNQHWGTPDTVSAAINIAYSWWKNGHRPTILIGDISAKTFSQTGCHSAHKTGTHIDMDLAGTLPGDPNYNQDKQVKCAGICWLAIQAGAKRVLFSDSPVAQAVNKLAQQKGFNGRVVVRADHDDHFHIEMPK